MERIGLLGVALVGHQILGNLAPLWGQVPVAGDDDPGNFRTNLSCRGPSMTAADGQQRVLPITVWGR